MQKTVFVVIPNYNGADWLAASIDSVLEQSHQDFKLVIVDNASVDRSQAIIEEYVKKDDRILPIFREKNYGFTGGVNPGMELAIKEGASFVAPFNNDAIADKDWLKRLYEYLEVNGEVGIATCKLLHLDGKTIDSTADTYTVWGLPYPRGRDEPATNKYDNDRDIFGASGGASMYRTSMLKEIGVFDQDFFAYYEDIDISFRAHLQGWKVRYVPDSIVYHGQGKTSERMPGHFTTRQYMKNLPMLLVKDIPGALLWKIAPRFIFAYTIFFLNAILQGRGVAAIKGFLQFWVLLPKKIAERRHLQSNRIVTPNYIWGIITHDLPPNAHKLRRLRSFWWKITRNHRQSRTR